MTLCELSTANHHSPPLECSAFSTEPRASQSAVRGESHRSCVEALSRSAQYWSSYSVSARSLATMLRISTLERHRYCQGYLPERNAGKLAFLQHLNKREASLHRAEEAAQLLLRVTSSWRRPITFVHHSVCRTSWTASQTSAHPRRPHNQLFKTSFTRHQRALIRSACYVVH
ncbi:uncharacterized protein B0H18DRAFT_605898 [Fomitopsis serialis]|uniref:uncharacterized protein n=1 Tax=Fomitopsis serialis TaxID=139415 RepID=UPI0020089B28|nr:uncharacterized protein B0H18DRAFT_605898 [Neoantrodia serialis]KAH9933912.1 hypothetical protein B0H18DRAFT_605898 [Neoantrodia serialis]